MWAIRGGAGVLRAEWGLVGETRVFYYLIACNVVYKFKRGMQYFLLGHILESKGRRTRADNLHLSLGDR